MATNPSDKTTGAPKNACDQSDYIEAGTQFIERPSTPEPLLSEEPLEFLRRRPRRRSLTGKIVDDTPWQSAPWVNPPPIEGVARSHLLDEADDGATPCAIFDDLLCESAYNTPPETFAATTPRGMFVLQVRRSHLTREIFPNGEDAFPFSSHDSADFSGWKDQEVIAVCLRNYRYSLFEQQLAIVEAWSRGFNPDVFRAMALNHASIREKTVRLGRSVRSKAWKSQAWISSARAHHNAAYQEVIKVAPTPLREVFLSDYVFGTPGFVSIGTVRFETRDQFRAAASVFSRDKSLFRAILAASNPKIFEVALQQKLMSDSAFARKLASYCETISPSLQSGVLTPSSSCSDLENEPKSWVGEMGSDGVDWERVGTQMRADQSRFDKQAMWDASQRVARLAVSVKLLFSASSLMDAIGVVYLYLSGESLGHLVPYLTEWFNSNCGTEFQSLGYSDNPTLADLFGSLVGFLGVTNVLGTMMGAAGDKLAVDFPLFQFLKDRFLSLSRQHNGDEKVTHFWATLKGFANTLWECVSTRSLEPLFEAKLGPTALVGRAEALSTYQSTVCAPLTPSNIQAFNDLKTTGKIPLDWMRPWSLAEYLEEVGDIHRRLKAILPITPSAVLPLVNRAISALQLKLSVGADAFQSNAFRPMPLGVALVGPAGVGKSVLMDRLITCTAARRGFCDDASTRYMWAADANFQDGLTPQHIWYIMDDIDVSLTQPVRGQRDHVVDIMSVIDTKPFPVESARAEEKGKNFGRPLLVLYGSNNEDLKLATFIKEESAIRRRLRIHALVLAKPQYRVGRGGVDWAKVEVSGKNGGFDVDPHEIHVSLFDHKTGGYTPFKVMGDSEFIRFVGMEFDRNLEEHSTRISREISSCVKCKTTVPKGDDMCEFCVAETVKRSDQTLEGQQPSRVSSLLDATERVAQRMDAMTEVLQAGDTAQKVARVVDKTAQFVEHMDARALGSSVGQGVKRVAMVSGVVSALQDAASATALGFADFVATYPAVVATSLAALIAAIALSKLFAVELQGRVNNSMQTISTDFVKVSDTKPTKGSFVDVTYSYSQMVTALRRNIGVFASVSGRGAHCVRVGVDLFIVNRHVIADIFTEGPEFIIQFEGVSRRGTLTKDIIGSIGSSDLALLKVANVPAAPTGLPYLWPTIDSSITAFDNVQLITPTEVRESSHRWNALKISSNQGYCGPTVFYDIETQAGDCGLPVIGEVNGRFRWIGIHHAGGTTMGFFHSRQFDARAPLFSKQELAQVAVRLGGTLNSARILQGGLTNKEPPMRELKDERHSELACALSRGAEVVSRGNWDAFRLFSNGSSTCKQSPFYEVAEPICAEITGVRHYWEIPKLRGAMLPVEGGVKWHSGFQNIFLFLRPTQDYGPLYPAIIDYLRPLEDCDRVGYEPLSEMEAILGKDGVPELKGANLATSMGPPFHVPKSLMVNENGEIDPRFREQIDEILLALDNDELPLPVGVCTLKDEPIKHTKNDVRDVRVFVCLMAAWNIVQKMHLFPIKMFLKNNPILFESMVGIDMTGDGPGMLHRAFQVINPDLDLIVEGDYTKMDKSINGVVAWGVVEVFGRIARLLGLDERVVRLLVLSNFHVLYSIQGDVFQAGAMNPSGSDITVEINAVANSLAHRAAWFRTRGEVATLDELLRGVDNHLSDFRSFNSLVTYGDDFLLAHPERQDLPALFAEFQALGFTVTDGQKASVPKYRTFGQVTFLKRQFFVEGDTVYAGLDLRSICRMLMIFKKSSLSIVDHSGVVLEEALREIFLRRDQPFDEWRARLRDWAGKADCMGSRYLRLLPFEDYQAMWDSKAFSSWKVELEQQEVDESIPQGLLTWTSFPQTLQSKMTSLDIVPALGGLSSGVGATQTTAITTNLPSNAVATLVDSAYGAVTAASEGGVMMTHAVGDVSSLTAPVMAGSLGVRRNDQPMATATLGDSLHRQVEIARFTAFSTPGATLALRPWKEWQENAFVMDKLRNFNFITGSIKVRGVCKAPPLCSGLVVVTAMPCYEPSATPQVLPKHLVFVGSHVALDLSTSSDFEMTLPWVGSSNWGNLEDGLFARMWNITVRVMSPIQSTIPSGCASAVLQLYAVPGEDFELSGAVFQGRRPVITRNVQAPTPTPYSGATGAQAPAPIQDAARSVQKATGYKPSQVAGAGAWMAGAAGALVPSMAVPASIVGGVLGVASKMLDYFGMTRETVPAHCWRSPWRGQQDAGLLRDDSGDGSSSC